jgi:predicted transcriptional regulator
VSNVSAVNPEQRVTIAARVPPDLAEAVAELANAGDRTVSREVFRAIKSHVERSAMGSDSLAAGESVLGRSSFVDAPAERDETPNLRGQSSSPQLAGDAERGASTTSTWSPASTTFRLGWPRGLPPTSCYQRLSEPNGAASTVRGWNGGGTRASFSPT